MACQPDTQALGCLGQESLPAATSAVSSSPSGGTRSGNEAADNTGSFENMECEVCAAERKRRCCVITQDEELRQKYKEAPLMARHMFIRFASHPI